LPGWERVRDAFQAYLCRVISSDSGEARYGNPLSVRYRPLPAMQLQARFFFRAAFGRGREYELASAVGRGLLKLEGRFAILAQRAKDQAQVVMNGGIFGVLQQGLFIVGDGLGQSSDFGQGIAQS
jgi:hypothetical protein